MVLKCKKQLIIFSMWLFSQVALEGDVLYSVPRELWLLIDHLYKHGLGVKDLFESNSTQENFVKLRNWLDFGSTDPIRILFWIFFAFWLTCLPYFLVSNKAIFLNYIPAVTVETVAETLLLFLSYTKEPVIPFHLHDAAIAASGNFQNCNNVSNNHLKYISTLQIQFKKFLIR